MLLIEQLLNGLQYSALLFLLASGLTLIFGIMGVVNLAHGAFYMVGAYCAACTALTTGSFWLGGLAAVAGAAAYGLIIEVSVVRRLYNRSHLDQVLATLGIIFFSNEMMTLLFGRTPIAMPAPAWYQGFVEVVPGLNYPVSRLMFIVVGVLVAIGLWFLISRTRLGMLIRAGADDHEMVGALGVNIGRLYTQVFMLGSALCGLAGFMAAPLLSVEVGMGEKVLITTFVVIVVGGVGSVRGALVGALLIGMIDSMGRAYIPQLLATVFPAGINSSLSNGLNSTSTYLVMALVLLIRPRGLLPARN